jgi:hypothetical protein
VRLCSRRSTGTQGQIAGGHSDHRQKTEAKIAALRSYGPGELCRTGELSGAGEFTGAGVLCMGGKFSGVEEGFGTVFVLEELVCVVFFVSVLWPEELVDRLDDFALGAGTKCTTTGFG